MMSEINRHPFTASQWQELEHQALIFKYMVSGVPIPPHLIFTVKTSLDSSISSNTNLFTNNSIGWGSFQMGFGRKADPEPGRCRRTDGKKWRCSKESYPDSKYCVRHMQRGRNRSRKPVEVAKSSSSISSITTNIPNSINSTTSSFSLSPLSSSMASETHPHHLSNYHNSFLYPSLYPHSSPSRPPASCFSPENTTTHHLFLDSGSYSQADKGYNFDNVPYTQLTMSSSSDYQGLADKSKEQQNQQQNTGFESARTIEVEGGEEIQKPLHHFFCEWPPKRGDSWLDIEENQSNYPSISTTQLSISMPLSTKELFQSKP